MSVDKNIAMTNMVIIMMSKILAMTMKGNDKINENNNG